MQARPVLISDVCDHSRLIKHKERGFLFDPNNYKSIAHSILLSYDLSQEEFEKMSKSTRMYAESKLSFDSMINGYDVIIRNIISD